MSTEDAEAAETAAAAAAIVDGGPLAQQEAEHAAAAHAVAPAHLVPPPAPSPPPLPLGAVAILTESIRPTDVLLGRGNRVLNHCGNVQFRRVVSHRRPEYIHANGNSSKNEVARQVMETIKTGRGVPTVEGWEKAMAAAEAAREKERENNEDDDDDDDDDSSVDEDEKKPPVKDPEGAAAAARQVETMDVDPGRFLQKHGGDETNIWIEADDKKALEKCKMTLRQIDRREEKKERRAATRKAVQAGCDPEDAERLGKEAARKKRRLKPGTNNSANGKGRKKKGPSKKRLLKRSSDGSSGGGSSGSGSGTGGSMPALASSPGLPPGIINPAQVNAMMGYISQITGGAPPPPMDPQQFAQFQQYMAQFMQQQAEEEAEAAALAAASGMDEVAIPDEVDDDDKSEEITI